MKKIKEIWSKMLSGLHKPSAVPAEGEAPAEKKRMPFWLRKTLWAVLLTGILTCFFVFLAFAWYAFIYLDDEFDLSHVDTSLNYTSIVYGLKDGAYVEAETLHTSENRIWINIDEIPDHLQKAFISIEDQRFYKHSGVDLLRTARAVLNFFNPSSSSSFGGSTITQQVIKNLTGEDEQTVSRKIQEIRRAWYVEREYKKDQILEVYLNTLYLSQNCYGVQTAAEVYFNKAPSELTLLECASIAAITKLPTYYDPIQNPENNLERAHAVINKMLELGYISQEEADAAKAEKLVLHNGEKKEETSANEINSYFVDQVIKDVIKALVNEKGYSEAYASSLVYSGGIQIFSTMDMDVQAAVDKIYQQVSNFPSVKSSKKQSLQSAIVILDNATGAVAGMAGGIGEKTVARGLNRATQSYFQPGSCMKPIGTYGPAIEYGTTIEGVKVAPGMLLLDQGVRKDAKGKWWPKNYDATTERLMSVQAALDQSKNTVAVRVNNALGAKTAYNFLQNNLGVTTLVPGSGNDENDQAMALGGLTKGISVLEITAAYEAFANDGTYTRPYTFTKICDQNGRVILENRVESHKAMEKNTAALINQMLQHAASYGTGRPGNFGTTALCGKTGTTSDDKDRWFVGYSKYYSAGVWVGYDQPDTIHYNGTNPAAVAFRKVMSQVHSGLPWKSFDAPTGLTTVEVCTESGKLATEKCAGKISGQFFADGLPTVACDVCGAVVEPVNPENPGTEPVNPENPQPPAPPVTEPSENPEQKPPEENEGDNPSQQPPEGEGGEQPDAPDPPETN